MKTFIKYLINCTFCAVLLGSIVFILLLIGLTEFEYCLFWATISAMFGFCVPLLDLID